MQHIFECTSGHVVERDEGLDYGHVYECPVCLEICVKVYPQGGGREWVIIPEETAAFHGLVKRHQPPEDEY